MISSYIEPRFHTAINYAMSLLVGSDGTYNRNADKLIFYGQSSEAPEQTRLVIEPSSFFTSDYGTANALPTMPLNSFLGSPLLWGTPIITGSDQLVTNADLIASTFFLVSRYEEYARPQVRDSFDRFPGSESIGYRAGFLQRPLIEEYRGIVRELLKTHDQSLPVRSVPKIRLTYDVDHLGKYFRPWEIPRTFLKAATGSRTFADAAEALLVKMRMKPDPYDNYEQLSEYESYLRVSIPPNQVEIIYYLMALEKSRSDTWYYIGSAKAKELIEKVKARGATIGYHASTEAGYNSSYLLPELDLLRKTIQSKVDAVRYHGLGLRGLAYEELEKAGIAEDSTLGYADAAGFRVGLCTPFKLFDPITMRLSNVMEHPLLIMDVSLSSSSYMSLTTDASIEYCINILDQVRSFNGELVLLWHNSSLAQGGLFDHGRVLSELLRYAAVKFGQG